MSMEYGAFREARLRLQNLPPEGIRMSTNLITPRAKYKTTYSPNLSPSATLTCINIPTLSSQYKEKQTNQSLSFADRADDRQMMSPAKDK